MALDLAELEVELARTRRKVQDWANMRMQHASDRKDQHAAFLQDQTNKFQNLQGLKQQLHVASEYTQKRLADEDKELQVLQDGLSMATTDASAAEKRVDAAQTQQRRKQEEYRQRITELENGQRQKQRQLESLRRAMALFADRFSMQFRHGQDELCLVMTNVDAFEHSKEFVISVQIQENTYHVTRCEPAVPGLDRMVAEVNTTNDFAAFVKAVRCGFVQVARSTRGLAE